jgi:hypothetical protein
MDSRQYNEKHEKDEKERSKHDEKTAEEKWRRDPLGTLTWAAILIYAGLVFLADNLGLLDALYRAFPFDGPGPDFLEGGAWTVVLFGAGVILLVEVVIRLMVPTYRQAVTGTLILAAILIGSSLGNLFGWELVWPLVIIAIGLGVLLRAFMRR